MGPMDVHTCPFSMFIHLSKYAFVSKSLHIHLCTHLYALAFWHLCTWMCEQTTLYTTSQVLFPDQNITFLLPHAGKHYSEISLVQNLVSHSHMLFKHQISSDEQ